MKLQPVETWLSTKILDEDDMASASGIHLATQSSVKTYIDNSIIEHTTYVDNTVSTAITNNNTTIVTQIVNDAVDPDNSELYTYIDAQDDTISLALSDGDTATLLAAQTYTTSQGYGIGDVTSAQLSATLTTATDYTDTQTAATLTTATDYTDAQTAATLTAATTYTDAQGFGYGDVTSVQLAATLTTATDYTDAQGFGYGDVTSTQLASALATAEGYADDADDVILLSAQSYSDTHLATAQSYSDTNLATAEAYADSLVAGLPEGVTSTQVASTIADLKTYTDAEIDQAVIDTLDAIPIDFSLGYIQYTEDLWYTHPVAVTSIKIKKDIKEPDFEKVTDDGNGSDGIYTYSFSGTSETECFINTVLDTRWRAGTDVYPVVRWQPATSGSSGDSIKWGFEYHTRDFTEQMGNSTISYTTDSFPYETYQSGKLYINVFPAIDMSSFTVGAHPEIAGRFFRPKGADYTGKAYLFAFGFIYRIFRPGCLLPEYGITII